MSNGEVCCILGVCCPPGSAEQLAALTDSIEHHHNHPMTHAEAESAAKRVLAKHDYFRDVAKLMKG